MSSAASPITTPEPSSSAPPVSSPPPSSSSSSTPASSSTSESSSTPAPSSSSAGGGGGGGSSSSTPDTSSTSPAGGGGGGGSSSSSAAGGGGAGGSSGTAEQSSTASVGGGGTTSTVSRFISTSTTTQSSILSSNGQPVSTVFVTSVSTSTTSATSSNASSHGSNNTAAIAGGVVGGVVFLAVIGLLILFCIRRKRNKDDFDGNFDPDRVHGHSTGGGTLPQIDLGEDEAAAATPYAYQRSDGGMSQFGGSSGYPIAAGAAMGASARSAGTTSPSNYPSSEEQHNNMPTSLTHQPLSSISSGSNYAPYGGLPPGAGRSVSPAPGQLLYDNNPMSAKEREAQASRYGSRNRLGLASVTDEQSNPPTSLGRGGSGQGSIGSGNVVVHQDGGRMQVPHNDHEPPSEIPPTYDSIPADDRA